jgi:hypothetical protein
VKERKMEVVVGRKEEVVELSVASVGRSMSEVEQEQRREEVTRGRRRLTVKMVGEEQASADDRFHSWPVLFLL